MAESSAREQMFLELVNRARMDPLAEVSRQGLADLNTGLAPGTISSSPKQVLAANPLLTDAARDHSQWMIDADIFSHTGVNDTDPGDRMTAAGYVFSGNWTWGENIAWSGTTGVLDADAAVLQQHGGLFQSPGHRVNILGDDYRELGVGAVVGEFTPSPPGTTTYNAMATTEAFASSGNDVFVTGVTYNDADDDDFYSIGEGVAGRTFELLSGGAVIGSAAGMAAGGYAIGVAASGSLELRVTGAGLIADIGVSFTLGALNVKIDVTDDSTIEANVSAVLTRAAANLTLLGIEDISGAGNGLDNLIVGNQGNNALNGGVGNDTLIGGLGNDQLRGNTGDDTYYVDTQSDLVFESAEEGNDTVISSVSFYLYAHIDNLTLTGTAQYGVGNTLANTLTGNAEQNLLIGWDGNDTIDGGAARDTIYGVEGDDTLYGQAGIDYIVGGNGNDTIYGGNDADEVYGQDGNDVIYGGDDFATDILVGGAGNDTIDGGAAWDQMYGNAGDDTFYVSQQVDWVFEQPGEGTDTVIADSPNGFYLYANIENLTLAGLTAFGVGNTLDNTLTGNAVTNVLLGGDGNDRINGKAGNDVLWGQNGVDTFVFERGTGIDNVGDFAAGTDKVELSGLGYSSYAQIQSLISGTVNTVINLGQGDFAILVNVAPGTLSSTDFVFS